MRICKITEGILHASSAVLCGISLSNLTAISLDRLLALQLGLRYRQVVTVPRVRGFIALSWLVYTSLGLLYYLNVDIYLIILQANTLLCVKKKKKKKKKFTAMITFHFHLQPQYKYELFHIKLHTLMYYSLNSLLHENRCHYSSSSSSDLRTGTTK